MIIKMKSTIKSKEGITLLELIICIAIVMLVIAGSFSLFSFGNKTFTGGSQQSYVQSDVRIISDYIQKQIRFATYVDTLDALDAIDEIYNYDPLVDGEPYNYFYYDGNKMVHKIWDEATTSYVTQLESGLNVQSLSFFSNNTEKLTIRVKSEDLGNDFELETEIVLPNLLISESLVGGSVTNEAAIRYSTDPILLGLSGGGGGPGGGGPGGGGPVSISISDIILAVPVQNELAQTTVDSAQFTGTISWSPSVGSNGKFNNNVTYTATITLTAKAGFTLSEVGQNFFKVSGATTVGNNTGSGIVTVVFPRT